ncbi:MAG: YjbE family putative metal transport protein, partial [Pseudomonadales bacterium]|nr:YjbE family putative metal transport protein [Pseudomonadales bacterium]
MQTIIDQIWPLFQVVLVDLVLAGDNAIVVALAAAGVPAAARQRVILVGIAGAAVTRILFALITVKLLQFPGLLLVGGLLLLWVCWNLWQDLRSSESRIDDQNLKRETKSVRHAIFLIIIADVSMSLDNVLAVAGVARDNTVVLIIGLALSVALMMCAATVIARILQKQRWIAYAG